MKKIAFLLSCLMVLGCFFTLSSCGGDESGLLFEVYLDGGEVVGYSVKGRGESTATDLVIPDTYKGKPVMAISDSAFSGCVALTSVKLPNSVVSIGGNAFKNCTAMKSINTPASLKTIGVQAFNGCESLAAFDIPDGIKSIGARAFNGTACITTQEGEYGDGEQKTKYEVRYVDGWAVGIVDMGNIPADCVVALADGTVGVADGLVATTLADTKRFAGSIFVPKSVKHVLLSQTFDYVHVNYEGTMEEWKAIAPRSSFPGLSSAISMWTMSVTCSDGDIQFKTGMSLPY